MSDLKSYWAVWRIRCVNRTTRELFDRDVWLDLSTISVDERRRIEHAIERDSRALISYRSRFIERERPDPSPHHCVGQHWFTVEWYYEDELGQPLTKFQLLQMVSGQQEFIVLGDPESVLRLGPAGMVRSEQWGAWKADDIAHYLEVCQCLSISEWANRHVSISYARLPNGETELLAFQCPDVLLFNSVLVFIRQLSSDNDKLVKRAIGHYRCHVDNDAKQLYVKERLDRFEETLNHKAYPPLQGSTETGRQILDLFFYGFGLIHRPDPCKAEEFRKLVGKYGREHVVQAVHFVLQQLVSHAVNMAIVISQDFSDWLSRGLIAKPTRVGIHELLRNIDSKRSRRPDETQFTSTI